jgi:hypothetical protein
MKSRSLPDQVNAAFAITYRTDHGLCYGRRRNRAFHLWSEDSLSATMGEMVVAEIGAGCPAYSGQALDHLLCIRLWRLLQVEKYRPRLLKDIVGNTEAVSRLQVIAEEGNMPNLILSVRTTCTCSPVLPVLAMPHAAQQGGRQGLGQPSCALVHQCQPRHLTTPPTPPAAPCHSTGSAWHRQDNQRAVPRT